jgi:hypothetical protein
MRWWYAGEVAQVVQYLPSKSSKHEALKSQYHQKKEEVIAKHPFIHSFIHLGSMGTCSILESLGIWRK